MAAERTSFLIVGGGIAGLSTAWHLARAGHGAHTVLLEAEPHLASHSSALNAAILRSLASDPVSTRLALRSAEFLRTPPAGFSDVPLVDAYGLVLVAGPERAEEVAGWLKACQGEPCRFDPLTPERLRAWIPFAGEVARAWSFPEDGRLDIGALVAGFARGARAGGVALRRGARVVSLLEESGRIAGVRLPGGEAIRARTTVVAAGGWAAELGASAGSRVRLKPTRRHLMVTGAHASVDRRWPVLWYFGAEDEGEFYCRPEGDGMLLCACDTSAVDPARLAVDDAVRRRIAAKAARYLPALADAGDAHFWCGMRTFTPDGRFAIGPDPDRDGLFWVAGLGGSGMHCAPEVGRVAADLLRGATVDAEVAAALAPARLATDPRAA